MTRFVVTYTWTNFTVRNFRLKLVTTACLTTNYVHIIRPAKNSDDILIGVQSPTGRSTLCPRSKRFSSIIVKLKVFLVYLVKFSKLTIWPPICTHRHCIVPIDQARFGALVQRIWKILEVSVTKEIRKRQNIYSRYFTFYLVPRDFHRYKTKLNYRKLYKLNLGVLTERFQKTVDK